MARGIAKGADNGVIPKIFAGFAHRSRSIQQMHAVQPQTFCQHKMFGNHQRDVAGVGHIAQCICSARNPVLVAGGQRKPDTRNFSAIQHGRQLIGKTAKFDLGWGDQIDLRVLGVGHLRAP